MKTIQRITDFLISSPPYSIIYMCAAVLLVMKKDLLGSTQEIDVKKIRIKILTSLLDGMCTLFLSAFRNK